MVNRKKKKTKRKYKIGGTKKNLLTYHLTKTDNNTVRPMMQIVNHNEPNRNADTFLEQQFISPFHNELSSKLYDSAKTYRFTVKRNPDIKDTTNSEPKVATTLLQFIPLSNAPMRVITDNPIDRETDMFLHTVGNQSSDINKKQINIANKIPVTIENNSIVGGRKRHCITANTKRKRRYSTRVNKTFRKRN